jgi:hypothetical protein
LGVVGELRPIKRIHHGSWRRPEFYFIFEGGVGVFFTNSIEKYKLVDIGRKGKDAVAKRLDHFLLSKNIMENNWKIKSKVVVGGISNHIPIML